MKKWLLLSIIFIGGCENHIDTFNPVVEESIIEEPQEEPLVLPSDPIIWMPFNNSTEDLSGNGLDGILYKGRYTTCRSLNEYSSLELDIDDDPGWGEANDRVEIEYDPILNVNTMTISAWVNLNEKTGDFVNRPYTVAGRFSHTIYGTKEDKASYILQVDKDLKLSFRIGVYIKSQNSLSLNTWHHVVVSVGDEIKLYIDGKLETTSPRNDLILTQTEVGLFLGETSMANGYWYHLDGKLDDFGLWGRVLTDCEINDLYNM